MRRLLILLFLPALLLLSGSVHALDDPSLAVPAAQYQQLIRDGRDPAGQTAAALIQQAEQQARQKNWPAAITAYETAIAAGADQTATWLALSQTWQSRRQQQESGRRSASSAPTPGNAPDKPPGMPCKAPAPRLNAPAPCSGWANCMTA